MGNKFGLSETVSMMVGGVVGGGIYAALGVVVSIAGPAAWTAYLFAGLIALCAGYSYIHLNRNLDDDGASVTFIESYWGNATVAGMVGWTLLIGYIGTMAMYGYAFGAFSQHMLPVARVMGIQLRPVLSTLVVLVFIGLNLLGVRETGIAEDVLVVLKVAIILVFGFWGVWFAAQQRSLTLGTTDPGFSPLIGAAVTFVSYEGWQLLFYDQEMIEDSNETLGTATYVALSVAVLIYVLVAITTTNLLPQQVVKNQADVALMIAAGEFMPPVGVALVGLSALFSTASAINATLFSSALYAKNMLTDGLLPDQFGDADKSGAPARTVLIIGGLTILFTIYGSLEGITSFASLSFIVVFGAMNFLAVRERESLDANRYVPIVGFVGSLVFLPSMVYYLYTKEHAVFNAVVLLATAVLAVEILYFERESIEDGLRTAKKKL
ncbi:APC family permease [Halocatena salina]|uniref:APC family permease n=1 Tax=Halocatena salina TaxID=2934340 RepID=A0A8T9ZZQ7_9EURY|nr:APC family permease [Halocatena salina]UPM42254.1 APC family permease [Halocatena salina]